MHKNLGFTFLELAIFLLIAGSILTVAATAWLVLVQGRQIAAAKNILDDANSCLWHFAIMARRIPTSGYFSHSCTKVDSWGTSLRFVSRSSAMDVNCTRATPGTISVVTEPGQTSGAILWLVVSAGPNKRFDYSWSSGQIDLSHGDDIYVFVSDMEAHSELCK